MKRELSRTASIVAALAAIHFAPALVAQTYQVTDLGLLDGAPTFATAINDSGIVCGYAQVDADTTKAWVSATGIGGLVQLPDLGGGDTKALAVGADGVVYGYGTEAGGVAHALMWPTSTAMVDLGTASPTDGLLAQGVNAGGVIAGFSGSPTAPLQGFTKDANPPAMLGAMAGSPAPATSAAYDINDAGQVVGVANWVGAGTRAFRTDAARSLVSLGTLGANDSFASAINAGGQVVGYSTNASNVVRAFLWNESSPTPMSDLGAPAGATEARAYGVNDLAQTVGMAVLAGGVTHGVLWQPGQTTRDLNQLIPVNSGWVLNEAQDINEGGDIVGFGTLNGLAHAFVMERYTGIDLLPPVAVATSGAVSQGSTTTQVTATFSDNESIVQSTLTAGTVRITGPNGYNAPGTPFSWNPDGTPGFRWIVIYNVPAPGGTWDPSDNGTYEIRVAPNMVSDLAGNRMPDSVIGSFTVGLQTTPTLTMTGLPATATAGGSVSVTLTATGSHPSSPADVFTFTIDWDGDGGDVQLVSGPSGTSVPHTFTSVGTRTARVRCTDPHDVQSTERTATITINNSAAPLAATEVLNTTVSNISPASAVVVEKNSTAYFFGGPFINDNTAAVSWNYLTGDPFSGQTDLDNGPIYFAGGGVDGRGRIVIFGGRDGDGAAQSGGRVYSGGGGMAALPVAISSGPTARESNGRLYIFGAALHRYDAGASGSGTWTTFATPAAGFIPSCMSFDGTNRIIAIQGTTVRAFNISTSTWTQLANAPAAFTRATLGADGFIYLLAGTQIWAFDPVLDTFSQAGATTYSQQAAPQFPGTDGYVYFVGGDGLHIERFDTRAAATRLPRISSTPAGTTLVQGTPWSYTISAGGKPRPTFSLVRGPAGMSIDSATGIVSWTPDIAQVGASTAVVRAQNSGGFAEQLITFNVLGVAPDTTPPTQPGGLAASNITTSTVDLSWSASSDASGIANYKIMEKRTGGNRWHRTTYYYALGTTAGLSWHLTGLYAGAAKTIYVAAVDGAGNQGATASITFTLLSPPSVYADSSGTFQGRWAIVGEPFTSNIFTAMGNPLPTLASTAAPAGAVWHSLSSTSGYYTLTAAAGLEGDQAFTVTATNSSGSASLSRVVKVWPAGTDLIPPATVTGITVSGVSWDSCIAAWNATTDNYGVTGYRVTAVHREPRRRFHHGPYNDHVVALELPSNATATPITGLRPSTSYMLSVQARDAAGLLSYGGGPTFNTLLKPFEVSASALIQTSNPDGSITLNWPGYGYYWKFTVQCSDDLANWQPVPPANQWPGYNTTFTFDPAALDVPCQFFRVLATPAAAPY